MDYYCQFSLCIVSMILTRMMLCGPVQKFEAQKKNLSTWQAKLKQVPIMSRSNRCCGRQSSEQVGCLYSVFILAYPRVGPCRCNNHTGQVLCGVTDASFWQIDIVSDLSFKLPIEKCYHLKTCVKRLGRLRRHKLTRKLGVSSLSTMAVMLISPVFGSTAKIPKGG